MAQIDKESIPAFIRNLINKSFELATSLGQTTITTEHVLHTVLSDPAVRKYFEDEGINVAALSNELVAYIKKNGYLLKTILPSDIPGVMTGQYTHEVDKIFSRATELSRNGAHSNLSFGTIITAISESRDSYSAYYMKKYGISAELIQNLDSNIKTTSGGTTNAALNEHCINLNEKVKADSDPLVGRESEIMTIAHSLSKRRKCNVLLVGEPGVGKTMIVEGLAQKINSGNVPKSLKDKVIYSLDVGSVLAGCKFRGDFEDKIKAIIADLVAEKNAILFVDEAHQMQAGEGNSGAGLGFSAMLKPELSRGRIKVIASTTYEGLRQTFEKDTALMRRFRVVTVSEPSPAEAVEILRGLSDGIQKFHNCVITDDAIKAAVELSVRYQSDKHLPDKAIDLIDSACARKTVLDAEQRIVDRDAIIVEVTEATGITVVSDSDIESKSADILNIAAYLKDVVIHQETAIDKVSESLIISRSGLKNPHRPVGSYVFIGPSGCGKTFLAQQLAIKLGMNLLKYDMSEYQEKHSVAKLIGAPPGYVGFGDGGSGEGKLVNDLVKNPNSVLLLDEVEKAHPDIFTVLLQLLDEGRITGSTGKVADARNCIIIMSSNLGTADAAKTNLGFIGEKTGKSETSKAVDNFFLTELRGRITAMIQFNKLDDLSFRKIVARDVSKLADLIHTRNIKIIPTENLITHIIGLNKNSQYGAREINRIVDTVIKYPLAVELLRGNIANGSTITLDWNNDALVIIPTITTVEIPLVTV